MRSMTTGPLHQQLQELDGLLMLPASLCTNSKRQRRPSVRLGDIGGEPLSSQLLLEKPVKRRKPHASHAISDQPKDEWYGAQSLTDRLDPGDHGSPVGRSLKQGSELERSESSFDFEYADEKSEEKLQDSLISKENAQIASSRVAVKERFSSLALKQKSKGKHEKRKHAVADRGPAGVMQRRRNTPMLEISWGSMKPSGAYQSLKDDPPISVSRSLSGGALITSNNGIVDPDNSALNNTSPHVGVRETEETDFESHQMDDSSPNHRCSMDEERLQTTEQNVGKNGKFSRDSDGNTPSLNFPNHCKNEALYAAASSDEVTPAGEVKSWLDALGLLRYASLFELHEVEKDVLPLLTMDDLREMGITAVGSRRKLYSAIQTLGDKRSCQV